MVWSLSTINIIVSYLSFSNLINIHLNLLKTLKYTNWSLLSKSNFLTLISCDPEGVNHRYFDARFLDKAALIVLNINAIQRHCKYSGRRIYQYNEDDFWFQFLFLSRCQTAWIHINMKVKINVKKSSLWLHKLLTREKLVNNKNFTKKSSLLYWHNSLPL